ncbi:MAG: hypothetical protein R3A10_01570 [Caldilineaceae bacterium]
MVGGYTLLVLGAGWMPCDRRAWPWPWPSSPVCYWSGWPFARCAMRRPTPCWSASFGVSIAAKCGGVAPGFTPGTGAVALPSIFTQNITVGGLTISTMNILTLVVCFTLLKLLTLFLTRSLLGIALESRVDDFTMTRLLGIPANWPSPPPSPSAADGGRHHLDGPCRFRDAEHGVDACAHRLRRHRHRRHGEPGRRGGRRLSAG